MAPTDKINLPFRWSFVPTQNAKDGTIRWTWQAYTQSGQLAMQSEGSFETFTECINNAKERGYGQR